MTRFVVAIGCITHQFTEFPTALNHYNCLKECGFHEATLRVVDEWGKTLVWFPSVGAFFPRGW